MIELYHVFVSALVDHIQAQYVNLVVGLFNFNGCPTVLAKLLILRVLADLH